MRIQAAVLRQSSLPPPYAASKPLEIVELDLGSPGRGEVLVQIKAAGLCHSDLSVIDGSRPRTLAPRMRPRHIKVPARAVRGRAAGASRHAADPEPLL